jgi:soluble lytic murein transglycosylase-like protein
MHMTELQTQCLHIVENLLKGEFAASASILKPSYVMAHCEIESSWRPDVLSSDGFGSRGLVQVLPETAREMGVSGSQAVPANSILAGMRLDAAALARSVSDNYAAARANAEQLNALIAVLRAMNRAHR